MQEAGAQFPMGKLGSFANYASSLNMKTSCFHCRLKDLSASMDKQHELLRLVVQKMEIHSESDDHDVGVSSSPPPFSNRSESRWNSNAKHNLQATVVNKWTKLKKKK